MKNSPLMKLTGALVALATLTSFGQMALQSGNTGQVSTLPITGKPGLGRILKQKSEEALAHTYEHIPTASEALGIILAENNTIPLKLYPPELLDNYKRWGNRSLYALEQFDPNAYALKAGDKANMSWLDATFIMGSPTSEAERNSDETQYKPIISYGFYMGNYEVTQNEYQQVIGSNPSYFTPANGYTADLNRPVENVTWAQANAFCSALTSTALANGSIPSGWIYRLPTEAEWEYSCRTTGGTQPNQVLYQQTDTSGEYDTFGVYPMGPTFGAWMVPAGDAAVTSIKVRMKLHSTSGSISFVFSTGQSGTIHYFEQDFNANDPLFTPAQGSFADMTVPVSPGSYFYGGTAVYVRLGSPQGHEVDYQGLISGGAFYPYMTIMGNTAPDPLSAFSFGNSIHGGMANFDDHYEYNVLLGTANVSSPTIPALNMTADVGSYNANTFGLYDMHGNVSEWCQDYYGTYPSGTVVDPQGPTSGSSRVVRGGSWADAGTLCRSAIRSAVNPSVASSHIGFRIVLAPGTPPWKTTVLTQPAIKTYGVPPVKGAGKDSLVLVTHGWYPTVFPPTSIYPFNPPDLTQFYGLTNAIGQYLSGHSLNNWQISFYDWTLNSWRKYPDDALNNATQEGISLGNSIVAQGWGHVHFIAHSAGAELIQVATEIIKANSPSTVVHCTFLDPYVGINFDGQHVYGNGANWSDRYSAHGDDISAAGPYTDIPLDSAYNVDVTALDPSLANSGKFSGATAFLLCSFFQASHGWPITFYQNSIAAPSGYGNLGFRQSAEVGTLSSAIATYPVGNIASVNVLGTPPPACASELAVQTATPVTQVDFSTAPEAARSATGTITKSAGAMTLITGSPAWLSIVPINTNAVNLVSFAANFTSSTGAAGLLTVYWDDSIIGTLDERTVGQGVGQYAFHFLASQTNDTHVLSFRLDPFTNIQSTVILTNVVLSQVGVTQPFSLSATTNTINGLPVWQLTGQAGFDYNLQATSDFVNWTQIAVLENTNGAVTFYDPASTNYTYRFYRAVAPY